MKINYIYQSKSNFIHLEKDSTEVLKLQRSTEVRHFQSQPLKSIGCDIEEDVQSLQHFSTDLIVEGTSRFIKVIRHDIDLPYKLPPGMSARFRIGTSLAEAVKELGYRGEVGYQTFLYSNESDIRRVFMFLVERLPKAGAETTEETMGGSEMLQRSIAHEISRRLKSPWTPPYCKSKGIAWRGSPPKWQREDNSFVHTFHADQLLAPEGLHDLSRRIPKERKSYYSHHLPLVTNQPRYHHDVAPSVIETNAISFTAQQEWETEWNQQGLASRLSPEEYKARKRQRLQKKLQEQLQQGMAASTTGGATQDLQSLIASIRDRAGSAGKTKGSRFTHTEKLQFAQDEDKAAAQMGVGEGPRVDTEEELQKKRQEEIEGLRNELQQLSSKLESLEIDIKKMSASKQQIEEQIKNIKTKNSEKEETYKVKKKTLDLLPDADNNIAKLQSMVDSSAQRLVNLANQWEKHRAPLIQQYRELKEVSEDRASEAQKKLEEIKELREKMKEVASEAKGKEDLYKQLVSEFERMTKDVNRSAYTRKIMEIVANIKKQKQEIDKVLIDTRAVQKEINQLSGKLDRTFTVTDELIFRDAKKEEAVRKAYKHLAALHENFNALIKTVEETGVIMREIRDLEDQIDIESKKKILSNLEKITNDYQEMKKENTGLISKLKKQ